MRRPTGTPRRSSRRGSSTLPLVPLIAGVAAVVVSMGSDDSRQPAAELTSSASDLCSVDGLVAASDLVVVARVSEITAGRRRPMTR